MAIKAILFDHDGVLADSESVFYDANRETFAEFGLALTPEIWGALYLADGSHTRDVAARLGLESRLIDALIERRNQIYARRLREGVPLMAGVEEGIAGLRGRLSMAIVTGCPRRQMNAIHGSGRFLDQFDCIITADDCEQSKPHPTPYAQAMQTLGMPASECVAVEDSPCGLASAVAAGLRCILIPSDLTAIEMCRDAYMICPDFPSAIAAIEELERS